MKNYDIQLGVCAMVLVCVPSCASMDESACISVSIAVFMFMCTHVCMSVCVCVWVLYACVSVCLCVHTFMFVCVYLHRAGCAYVPVCPWF